MRSHDIDMLRGSIPRQLFRFTLPIMLSSVLQLLFNAMDVIVIGQFRDTTSLAAVTSTGALTNLIVNLFLGLSVGSNVLVARSIGSGNKERLQRTIHTAVTISLIVGSVLAVIGYFAARPLLDLMKTGEALDKATTYLSIYFLGMPVIMLYNFGSAILRAKGDTKRPLLYLTIAGIVNVIFNVFFVAVCNMDVEGVAIATVMSFCVSSVLVTIALIREKGDCHLSLKKLRIYKKELFLMMEIGIPAGIQGTIFSLSNTIIQSSVNSFGTTTMAGNGAAANIEGFVYAAMNAFHHGVISFAGQNHAAGLYHRVRKTYYSGALMAMAVGLSLGLLALLIPTQLLHIYTEDAAAIETGILRMSVIMPTYFTCGLMDVHVGVLRGIGRTLSPTIINIFSVCGIRILFIYTIFRMEQFHSLFALYLTYPVSWILSCIILASLLFYSFRSMPKVDQPMSDGSNP